MLLLHLLKLLLLLLFEKLGLLDPLHELVWVAHYLGNKVLLIIVLEVVDLFEVFVVLSRYILNVSKNGLILEVQLPILSIVVKSWGELRGLL